MGTISTSVGLDRLSRVSGYTVKRGRFNNDTQNLLKDAIKRPI